MKNLIFVTVLVALSLKFETFVKADNGSEWLGSTVIFSKFDDNGSSNESDGTTGTDATTERTTRDVTNTTEPSPTESTRTDATTERTTREVTKTTEPSPTESTGTPFTDDELGSDEVTGTVATTERTTDVATTFQIHFALLLITLIFNIFC